MFTHHQVFLSKENSKWSFNHKIKEIFHENWEQCEIHQFKNDDGFYLWVTNELAFIISYMPDNLEDETFKGFVTILHFDGLHGLIGRFQTSTDLEYEISKIIYNYVTSSL